MSKNVGGLDQILRIAVGSVLILATAMGALPAWGWVGVIPFVTGVLSWCPAYTILGFKTCSINPEGVQ